MLRACFEGAKADDSGGSDRLSLSCTSKRSVPGFGERLDPSRRSQAQLAAYRTVRC